MMKLALFQHAFVVGGLQEDLLREQRALVEHQSEVLSHIYPDRCLDVNFHLPDSCKESVLT